MDIRDLKMIITPDEKVLEVEESRTTARRNRRQRRFGLPQSFKFEQLGGDVEWIAKSYACATSAHSSRRFAVEKGAIKTLGSLRYFSLTPRVSCRYWICLAPVDTCRLALFARRFKTGEKSPKTVNCRRTVYG